jgi:hypothetical protein
MQSAITKRGAILPWGRRRRGIRKGRKQITTTNNKVQEY